MFRRFMGERIFCGLDIGAQSIKSSIVRLSEGGKPELLGVYEARTAGLQDSSISDLGELSESIQAAVSGLLKKTRAKVKDVQLGIGGGLIKKKTSTAVMPLVDRGNKVIGSRDIRKIRAQARLLGANMDEYVMHDFPEYYRVDDINTAVNPLGLFGRKLELKTLLILLNNTLLKNLTKAVNQVGNDVANISFSSCSSACACLTDFHRKQGVVFIDIGAKTSDILFFKEDQLKFFVGLNTGSEHITEGIASRLQLNMGLAEEIKKSYASIARQDSLSEEEILIKREDGYLPMKKQLIFEAVAPVVSRLVEQIREAVVSSRLAEEMNGGVIMAGGGALLPGLLEHVEQATGMTVKFGKIALLNKRLNHASRYASAVGLAQGGLRRSSDFGEHEYAHSNWAAAFSSKVKELYQEYF